MHFAFTFVSVRLGSNSLVLHVFICSFQYHLLKKQSFHHWVFLVSSLNISDRKCRGLILDSLFCSLVDVCIFMLRSYCSFNHSHALLNDGDVFCEKCCLGNFVVL